MDHIDYKYMMLASPRLEMFKDVGNGIYNFRCPFCGDSKKHKNKARGYFFPVDNTVAFKCHNCGKSIGLPGFLQEVDHGLFTQYKLEKFGKPSKKSALSCELSTQRHKEFVMKTKDPLKDCYRLSDVPNDLVPVLDYANSRQIPSILFDYLYAARNLNDISTHIERYKDKKFPNSPVLVIPFFRRDGSYSYIQCRSIESEIPKRMRFITFELDEGVPKLWGEFRVNWTRPIYVLEGPIDAMFIVNGVALAGAAHNGALSYIKQKQIDERGSLFLRDICLCYDNDYLVNPDVMNQLIKRIDEGFSVVLYDKNFKFKDINDAIKGGWGIQDINNYVRERTFNGLAAKLEISRLRRG
jgi:hypothetical protein